MQITSENFKEAIKKLEENDISRNENAQMYISCPTIEYKGWWWKKYFRKYREERSALQIKSNREYEKEIRNLLDNNK